MSDPLFGFLASIFLDLWISGSQVSDFWIRSTALASTGSVLNNVGSVFERRNVPDMTPLISIIIKISIIIIIRISIVIILIKLTIRRIIITLLSIIINVIQRCSYIDQPPPHRHHHHHNHPHHPDFDYLTHTPLIGSCFSLFSPLFSLSPENEIYLLSFIWNGVIEIFFETFCFKCE